MTIIIQMSEGTWEQQKLKHILANVASIKCVLPMCNYIAGVIEQQHDKIGNGRQTLPLLTQPG